MPEYGGMQVKIDDKELFMFRFIFVVIVFPPPLRGTQLLMPMFAGTTKFSVC